MQHLQCMATVQMFLRWVCLMMHIFSKITNDVDGVLKQRLINSNNTPVTDLLSFQNELNTFWNELFQASDLIETFESVVYQYLNAETLITDVGMMELMMMVMMQVCVAHRRSIQLYTVCEDRVIALKDVSVAESPLTLVMLILCCHKIYVFCSYCTAYHRSCSCGHHCKVHSDSCHVCRENDVDNACTVVTLYC